MQLRQPNFWRHKTLLSFLLLPISLLFRGLAYLNRLLKTPTRVSVPVICVGNVSVGGAGKTPTVMAVCELLRKLGRNPHVISRGYKGHIKQTTRVDPSHHTYQDVGDEPLLIATHTPCWIGIDRVASAQAAIAAGADVVVMDDGFQNPSLHKDVSLLVIDPRQGFGNGFCLPAGPLRETLDSALSRTDAVIQMGEGSLEIGAVPSFGASIHVMGNPIPKKVVAFAGLGNPAKFVNSLMSLGFEVIKSFPYPDHHAYTEKDMVFLSQEAEPDLTLITTSKDAVRIPPAWRDGVEVLYVNLFFDDEGAMQHFLKERLSL